METQGIPGVRNFIDGGLKHLDFNMDKRMKLADIGQAMPGGQYPIRNRADLKRAIQAYGRAKNKNATMAWIIKRAKDLDAEDLIPEGWTNKGKTMHMTILSEFLEHHGIKGQKWGVRRKSSSGSSSNSLASTKHLSNDDLRKAVDRMRLEQQFSQLTAAQTHPGRTYAKSLLEHQGKSVAGLVVGTAASLAIKSVFKSGGNALAKNASKKIALKGLKKFG